MSTKADAAYLALRRAIVVGEVDEDEALDELKLSARFAVGRTPLREALKRLAQDGLVVAAAHRSPYVRTLSATDISRLYETRLILEEPAGRLAAERATVSQLDELDRINAELSHEVGQDVYASIEADHAFHLSMAKASGNRFLVEAVDRLNCGSLRLWYRAHTELGYERVSAQHQDMIDALRSRDAQRTSDAVRAHIKNSLDRQIQLMSPARLGGLGENP